MSEFKFACPVCGQHITADSSASGGQLECPTCFQKIVVPQAAAEAHKFILNAAQVAKPREITVPGPALESVKTSGPGLSLAGLAAGVLLLGAAGGALYFFRDKIFRPDQSPAQAQKSHKAPAHKAAAKAPPPKNYPMPTNITWTLDLGRAAVPDATAVGSLFGRGFFCEKAILQGGHLTLRQGRTGPPDLGVSVYLFAKAGEELSGKTVEIRPDRPPPIPKVVLRRKDEQDKAVNMTITGYALKLVFGDAVNGRIPGKVFLCLPDDDKSFVAGTFEAEIRKPAPPKPRSSKTPPVSKPPG